MDAATGDSRYTPSNVRREARKLNTQSLHESWQEEYRVLKQRQPGMSGVWYSQRIAKVEIAQGLNARTRPYNPSNPLRMSVTPTAR